MRVSSAWVSTFACYSASCRPPTSGGTGGSSKGKTAGTGFVSRSNMPQLTGVPRPNTMADKLPRTPHGTVNAGPAFVKHLKSEGISVTDKTVPAKSLRASQKDMVESSVTAMVKRPPVGASPIFTSSDGYVIDGHHRWAAEVVRGGSIKVREVGMAARPLIQMARKWSRAFGLPGKAV
jgi:hypothetical protein